MGYEMGALTETRVAFGFGAEYGPSLSFGFARYEFGLRGFWSLVPEPHFDPRGTCADFELQSVCREGGLFAPQAVANCVTCSDQSPEKPVLTR